MRNGLIRILLVVVLIISVSGGFAFIGLRITRNTLSLKKLYNRFNLETDINTSNLGVISSTLKKNKVTLKRLRRDLKKEHDDQVTHGKMTEAIHKEFSRKFIDLGVRLTILNDRLAHVSKVLKNISIQSPEQYSEISRVMYENSLECSVLIRTSYYDKGKLRKDKDGKLIPNAGSSGSGTVIAIKGKDSYILTAAHVISPIEYKETVYNKEKKKWEQVQRVLEPRSMGIFYPVHGDKSKEYKLEVLFKDTKKDLAVVVIRGYKAAEKSKIVALTDLDSINVLDPVYIIGSPLGNSPRLNKGEITAWRHALPGYIEANCPSVWGNSGGGLFRNGVLIGVVSMGRGARVQLIESLGLYISPKIIIEFLRDNKFSVEVGK